MALTANTVPKASNANTLTNSTITDDGTIVTINTASVFGASVANDSTRNFFRLTGTMPTVPTAQVDGVFFNITSAGSAAQTNSAFRITYGAGYTGASVTAAASFRNQVAGTGTDLTNGAFNVAGSFTTSSTTTGTQAGVFGNVAGGDRNIGILGKATGTKNAAVNIGGAFYAVNAGSTPIFIGMYADLVNGSTSGATESAAVVANNNTQAVPIFIAKDAGAAVPTTAATATVVVTDGAQLQYGNGVLTNATMTAETQANVRRVVSSYTWSNAQVVALGAALVGDITVATLPAKTQVRNAYVVITGAAAGPTTVTVSCGDAIGGTPFINYVVASDAKAAANTVYGDAAAERGTSIDVEFYYMPSYTATTLVTCHFISTVLNLDQVTGSTGRVILETALLP